MTPARTEAGTPAVRARLRLCALAKAFGSTRALDGVSLEVMPGEVHVIAGENGAGKSTLIRILSGVYTDYAGEIFLDGGAVRLVTPAAARVEGVATIHQELSLVPALSIVDNLLLSAPGRAWTLLSRRRAREHARQLMASVDLDANPDALVETLSLSERQLLEIGRALHQNARVLILDEPTSALSEADAQRLFAELDRIRVLGTSILYISHRMEEIRRLADRITVLRDGKHVTTRAAAELSDSELIAAMVGRELVRGAPALRNKGRVRLRADGLVAAGAERFGPLDLELRSGEIVGIAGLRGSGASRVAHALYGAEKLSSGRFVVDAAPCSFESPADALARGVVLLASDRRLSVFPELSLRANATLSSLRALSRWGVVLRARERRTVESRAGNVALRSRDFEAAASTLSGGNQQKLALLRCLLTDPGVLLLDDPTRGVDVSAKREIYELIVRVADAGAAILLFSSELEELVSTCDRVLVLSRGQCVTTLRPPELTRERLLGAMIGAPR